jgi:flagellar hook-basal body complex protein FliE
MDLLNVGQTKGWDVEVLRTDPRHFDSSGNTGPLAKDTKETFQGMLNTAIEGVNSDQIKATDLYQRMVTDPDSVDVHDVTIAAAKAQMSLNLAKTTIERGLQAYRDIINMR